MTHCAIIGITDSREQWLSPQAEAVVARGCVFSGGKRHHEIMRHRLPSGAVWIDITVPISGVVAEYAKHDDVVVFASGDPLFYGFAATLQRECPDAVIEVYPAHNSLQTLAHRMLLPYQDMVCVSQTGRPWLPLDEALISGHKLIGVLTDRNKTPQAIAQRMSRYGYDNYSITVGECLGNEDVERVTSYPDASALAAEQRPFAMPNCMMLCQTGERERPFGIPESEFHLLDGRARMITKMPVRLVSLSMLDLRHRRTLWDIGFCTGSVSIEAKLQFPHLDITAFEVRPEGEELMELNSRRFGTPGIHAVIGDFLSCDIAACPRPDAVFIGGHGGRLEDMMLVLGKALRPGGCVVFNSVSDDSKRMFEQGAARAGMRVERPTLIKVDEHNPIWVMKATVNG